MEFANTDWNEFIKRYIEYNNSENKDIYKQAEAIKRKMQDVLRKHNFGGTLEKDVALYETIFRPYDNAISILGIPELEWEDFKDFRQKLYERKAEGTEQWKAYNEPYLISNGFEIYMQAIVFYAILENTLECLQFRIEWKKEEAEHKRILDILTPASNKEEETEGHTSTDYKNSLLYKNAIAKGFIKELPNGQQVWQRECYKLSYFVYLLAGKKTDWKTYSGDFCVTIKKKRKIATNENLKEWFRQKGCKQTEKETEKEINDFEQLILNLN
ncbi:MAG: hypothetical protein PUG15_01160 [Bacteroidales bacterium]|nr:hypothetical protein [Bacteroidales bacterium]